MEGYPAELGKSVCWIFDELAPGGLDIPARCDFRGGCDGAVVGSKDQWDFGTVSLERRRSVRITSQVSIGVLEEVLTGPTHSSDIFEMIGKLP